LSRIPNITDFNEAIVRLWLRVEALEERGGGTDAPSLFLTMLEEKVDTLMSKFDDVFNSISRIEVLVGEAVLDIRDLEARVATAAVTPVSVEPAELDAIAARLGALADRLEPAVLPMHEPMPEPVVEAPAPVVVEAPVSVIEPVEPHAVDEPIPAPVVEPVVEAAPAVEAVIDAIPAVINPDRMPPVE
jgi:hypothetical protein